MPKWKRHPQEKSLGYYAVCPLPSLPRATHMPLVAPMPQVDHPGLRQF